MPNKQDPIYTRALTLANLAYEIGDYKAALKHYDIALSRIHPVDISIELTERVRNSTKQLGKTKTILRPNSWQLSKSSFVKGEQCIKYLYLDKYKSEEQTPHSKETLKRFQSGHNFEDAVREKLFPTGINVKEKVGDFAYFNSYTKYLLDKTNTKVIYEATIIEDEIIVMCDILVKNEKGLIDVYEIKSSTELNDAIRNDIAIQYNVLKKRFGDKLNKFNVILRKEDNDFDLVDFTKEAEKRYLETNDKIELFKLVLKSEEPIVKMGAQCDNPYECVFKAYCKQLKTTNNLFDSISKRLS